MDIKTIELTLESLRRMAEEVGTSEELALVRYQEALWESFLEEALEEGLGDAE